MLFAVDMPDVTVESRMDPGITQRAVALVARRQTPFSDSLCQCHLSQNYCASSAPSAPGLLASLFSFLGRLLSHISFSIWNGFKLHVCRPCSMQSCSDDVPTCVTQILCTAWMFGIRSVAVFSGIHDTTKSYPHRFYTLVPCLRIY